MSTRPAFAVTHWRGEDAPAVRGAPPAGVRAPALRGGTPPAELSGRTCGRGVPPGHLSPGGRVSAAVAGGAWGGGGARACGLGSVTLFHGWRLSTGLPSGSWVTNVSSLVQSSK